MLDPWDLPGPAMLRERMRSRLRDGGVLVLGRTASSLGGADMVLERLASSGHYFARLTCDGASPAIQVQARFDLELQPGELLNANALVQGRGLQGYCVLIEGLGAVAWPAWQQFLLEFQHACRTLRPEERGTLCCVVDAGDALSIPGRDVNLTLELLDSWVREMDLLEYGLHQLLDREAPHPLYLARVAASIALWDLPLMDRILDEPEALAMSDPTAFLVEVAALRGWGRDLDPSPANGGRHPGTLEIHSCFHALAGAREKLMNRQWSGQIGHFLPLLERQRQKVLPDLERHIRLPVANSRGEQLNTYDDLELGDIWYYLRRNGAPVALCERARMLRDCRNSLAHLRPLGPEEIHWLHRQGV